MDAVIDALMHERGAAGFSPTVRRQLAATAGRAERMELAKAVGLDPATRRERDHRRARRRRPYAAVRNGPPRRLTRHATRTPPSPHLGDRRLGDLAATSIRGRTRVGPIGSVRPIARLDQLSRRSRRALRRARCSGAHLPQNERAAAGGRPLWEELGRIWVAGSSALRSGFHLPRAGEPPKPCTFRA